MTPSTRDVVCRPDVRYGDAAILTPQALAEWGGGRVLLVCGRHSFEASGASRMLHTLNAVADIVFWDDFTTDPAVADLVKGLAIVEKIQPHIIIGVGGGSTMDMAKLLCAFDGIPDEPRLRCAIRQSGRIAHRGMRLVLVPTTSGSGSQATHFAVLYIADEKYSVAGSALRPDVVILDPLLAMRAAPYQRAASGLDAVSHAIESLWAVGANGDSRGYARRSLRALLPAIEPFVGHPTSATARAMAIGSHLAGRAIDISNTTVAHALSYGITKRYGVAHGHAVALTLGAFIEALATAGPSRLRASIPSDEHAVAMHTVFEVLGASGPVEARRRFETLAERLGASMRLSDIGISNVGQIRDLARRVNAQRLDNCPVSFSADELTKVCLTAL